MNCNRSFDPRDTQTCIMLNAFCSKVLRNGNLTFAFCSLLFSSVVLIFVGIIFIAHPHLSNHQHRLTGITLLFEGGYFWNHVTARLVCKGYWPDLDMFTQRLQWKHKFTTMGFQLDVLMFWLYYWIQIANLVLSMDLYLAIYNPFKSQNARLKQEVALMVVMMAAIGYYFT